MDGDSCKVQTQLSVLSLGRLDHAVELSNISNITSEVDLVATHQLMIRV